MRVRNGTVFAVAGSKGGVGKTTTSINLSAVLAEMEYDVVLVELDLAMANVGDFLDIDVGLEGEDPTLHEVLAGTSDVVDATYDSPCEFDVVPSGAMLRGFRDADVGALPDVLSTLRFAYDVIVIDTGAGVTRESLVPVALADETILVSSPRVASVRDTMKTRDLTRQVGGSVAGVVFVKSGTGRSPSVDHIADFLSVDLLGHVPEDSAVADAQDVGRPVVVAARESDAAEAYRDLGERIVERIDVLGTSSSAVLTADSEDRDGSGFAFVDRPAEADDGDDAEGNDADGGETGSLDGEPERDSTRADPRRATDREHGDPTEPSPRRRSGGEREARTDPARDRDDDADTDGPEAVGGTDVSDGTATVEEPDVAGEAETVGRPDTDGTPETTVASGTGTDAAGETTAGSEPEPKPETAASPDAATDAEAEGEAPGVADGGRTAAAAAGVEPDRSDSSASEASEESEASEASEASEESTTKRLIDRAMRMVDRRTD